MKPNKMIFIGLLTLCFCIGGPFIAISLFGCNTNTTADKEQEKKAEILETYLSPGNYILEIRYKNISYIVYSSPNGVCKLTEEFTPYERKESPRPEGLLND